MRLIDADKLENALNTFKDYKNGNEHFLFGIETARELVSEAVSVEAVPVVHGRWVSNGIEDSMLSACTVCGFSCGAYSFSYCPNCGAKMDGERR